MRISDWSSDVCSSDLLCAAYLNSYESEVRQRPFIAVQAKLNKSNETTKNYTLDYSGEPGTSYPANVCGSYTINTSEINNRDRKSVVEGQSVSVRVDIGGRRIIKKTKINNIMYKLQQTEKKNN